MTTKETALFLRKFAESLREDLHSRKALSGTLLEEIANELDPPAGHAHAPEVTSPEVAAEAAKLLQDESTPASVKSVAASALTQAHDHAQQTAAEAGKHQVPKHHRR